MNRPCDLLWGRKTFEIFASYWPQHDEEGAEINRAIKYVASNTLSAHDWHKSVFFKGDVQDDIRRLKSQTGPDLQVHGSSNLIQSLLRYDLLDEFWLKIFPVIHHPVAKGRRAEQPALGFGDIKAVVFARLISVCQQLLLQFQQVRLEVELKIHHCLALALAASGHALGLVQVGEVADLEEEVFIGLHLVQVGSECEKWGRSPYTPRKSEHSGPEIQGAGETAQRKPILRLRPLGMG